MSKYKVQYELKYYFSSTVEAGNESLALGLASRTIPIYIEEFAMRLRGNDVMAIDVVDAEVVPEDEPSLVVKIDAIKDALGELESALDNFKCRMVME